MIHIAFTLFQRNSKSFYPLGLVAAYASIKARTQASICVHVILDKSVGLNCRKKITESLRRNDEIYFYEAANISESYQLSFSLDGPYSPAIIWRIWIDRYLAGIDKCILIDCDLLFSLDIQYLWDIDLKGASISAPLRGVPHSEELHQKLNVSPENYFRMCCSVLNLAAIRNHQSFQAGRIGYLRQVASWFDAGLWQAGLLEQSVFNHFFSNSCTSFPFPVIPVDRLSGHPREDEWRRVINSKYEFLIDVKGWNSSSSYSLLFWAFLIDTGWRDDVLVLLGQSPLFRRLQGLVEREQ